MKKIICDVCGGKVNSSLSEVIIHSKARAQIAIVEIVVNLTNDDVDVCKYCILDAIKRQLDDRPKPVIRRGEE